MGAKLSAAYTAPATYQDHRDQQQSFQTSSGKIAFTDHGTGPVLVMLHGVPTSSWMYRKVIPELQASMRVITIDHLGFGSSDKPDGSADDYSAAGHAARTRELLDALNVSDYGVLMHDMGGLVAWEMLRADESAISHLVVLNTNHQ
jgi:pimeloyl-ACP methyl ester carboxylesterase